MEKILLNLANIHLIEFCKAHNIDCSGTFLFKYSRRWTYALVRDIDGLGIVTVTFYKNRVPSYYVTKNL